MKLAEHDGADAFDLELQALEPGFRTPDALRCVFDQATRPIFTVYRRYTLEGSRFAYAEADEEARMRAQLELIDIGSIGFGMELDPVGPRPPFRTDTDDGKRRMFDRHTPPHEISYDPRAVERQVRLVEEAHRRGGQVMASSHAL